MKSGLKIGILLLALTASTFAGTAKASAQTKVEATWDNVFSKDEEGRTVFQPTSDAHLNARLLQAFLNTDDKKTLVIPSKTTVKISYVVDIGSNTTIIANGATIIQTVNGKGVLAHNVDGGNYNAISNVEIIGGTWKNEVNSQSATMMRFAHGKNLTFDGVNIDTNYQGHGLELIACKNCVVKNCKILAKNNKTKNKISVEEALQIDIATPLTAPGILREGGKQSYVNGQICQNISVENCTVRGSRGICANLASKEQKFLNKFHKNITITGCHITGETAEALALFNSFGCTVKDNTIKSNSTRGNAYADGIHFTLVGKSKEAKKYENAFTGNTVYGKYYGIDITTGNVNYPHGTVTVKNNTVYSSKGKNYALHIVRCQKVITKKNKCLKRK